jgi:hypothetical protein
VPRCAPRCSDAAPIQEDPAAAPSQRLTPYLVKSAAKRPVTPASGKFGEREHSGAVHAVLNPAIKQPDFAEVRRGAVRCGRRGEHDTRCHRP